MSEEEKAMVAEAEAAPVPTAADHAPDGMPAQQAVDEQPQQQQQAAAPPPTQVSVLLQYPDNAFAVTADASGACHMVLCIAKRSSRIAGHCQNFPCLHQSRSIGRTAIAVVL